MWGLRFIVNSHRQHCERRIPIFVTLVALTYSLSIAPCIGDDQMYAWSPRKLDDSCEISFRRSLGSVEISDSNGYRRRAILIQDHVIPRLSAAALLRDNLLTFIRKVLFQCLDEDIRVSFERLHDAFLSRHIAVYDVLPILLHIRGKTIKQQIYTVLEIIERIGGTFVSGYASIAKAFIRDDRVELKDLKLPNDLLLSIDDRIVMSIAIDKQENIEFPITEEEALTEIMYGLKNGWTNIELRTVAALMLNIPNFDTKNPEVPGAIRLVADHMNDKLSIDDNILNFLSYDVFEGPDILVKTILERIELSENSSVVLRESVGILLQAFDTKPWDRKSKIDRTNSRIFETVSSDYYPNFIVAIAKFMNDHPPLQNSLRIESTFYDDDTQILLEFLTRFYRRGKSMKKFDKILRPFLSFVSQINKKYNDLSMRMKPIGFHEVLMHFSALNAPCMPRKMLKAAKKLNSIVTEDSPWSFAYGNEEWSENPLKSIVKALIKLRTVPLSSELRIGIDDVIFQAKSNRFLGSPSLLYKENIIFQRSDSNIVEVDMYSLLSYLPSVFDEKKFAPLLLFVTKSNFLDYLGREFNIFEYTEPRDLLLAMLKRTLKIKAVRAIKPLLQAVNSAIKRLEEPLLINLYSTTELQQRILEILPNIHQDPRYIPLKILFKKKYLFSYISSDFNFDNINSTLDRFRIILRTIVLKTIDLRTSDSIRFALGNANGSPPLPMRAFNREDFVHLVNNLLRNDNQSRVAILQSPLYNEVAVWHPSLAGPPEVILSRILNYPVEELSKNVKFAKIVRHAEDSLAETEKMKVTALSHKTIRTMYERFPDDRNLRIAKLLFETANLEMLMPEFNNTKLEDLEPHEATKNLLENLVTSLYVKSQNFLFKCISSALKVSNDSKKIVSRRDLAAALRDILIHPFNSKFESVMRELKKRKYRDVGLNERLRFLKYYLYKLRDKSRSSNVRRAAQMAISQGFSKDSDYDSKKSRIGEAKLQNVLESVAGPHNVSKEESTVKMIRKIVDLIPQEIVYEPIRSVIQSPQVYDRVAKINWKKYRSVERQLGAILEIIENTSPYDGRLKESLMELRRYIDSRFDIVIEKELKLLLRELHNFDGNTDLVPLKLFFTRENLLKYLPKNVNFTLYNSPQEALIGILDMLREVPNLKRQENLYEAMTSAREILTENQSTIAIAVKSTKSKIRLTPYNLRFVLALKIEDSELRELLNPKKMFRLLPKDFEFFMQTTFKTKALHLLGQLMKSNNEFLENLAPLHRRVQTLPDVPSITNEQLQPLLDIIPRDTLPNFGPIRKLLRVSTLTRLLPGDFDIESFEDPKSALREVLRIFQLTWERGDESLRRTIVILMEELRKKKSKFHVKRSTIDSDELQSLIDEIPFDKYAMLRETRKNFTVKEILSLLPQEFDARQFPTKKSRLMGILNAIATGSKSEYLRQSIKVMLNLVSMMPDAPRIHNADIAKALSKIPISPSDLKTLANHCSSSKLGSRLPINFDINSHGSTREKLFILLKYCNETISISDDIGRTLSNAMTLAKKLPTADLTGSRVNEIFSNINCGNFSATKPLKMFLLKHDIASLLPWDYDLDIPITFNRRIEYLLKTLLSVRELKPEYEDSLQMMLNMVKNMPVRVEISKNLLLALQKLPIMQMEKSGMCREYLTFSNVRRSVPPIFSVEKFPNDESRLTALLFYFNKSPEFRGNRSIYESCKFVDEAGSHSLKKSVLHRLKNLVEKNEQYLLLKFFFSFNEDEILDELTIPHDCKNENFNDTVRTTLKSLLSNERVSQSKALVDSIVSLLGTLPKFRITKFDIDEAVSEIPKTNEYESLRIFLRCADVMYHLHGTLSVPSDYTAKRVLLVILNNLTNSSFVDDETLGASIDKLSNEVKREVRDQEVEEMFKQLKNRDTHFEKLQTIRSFYVAEGPEKILGSHYSEEYLNKLERLQVLRKKLMTVKNQTDNDDLQRSLEYLTQILKNGTSIVEKSIRFIDDIDLNSLLVALPKTTNDTTILGLVRFFSNQHLLQDLGLKNSYDYRTKKVLLREIVLRGLNLESVKRDRMQSQALKSIKEKFVVNDHDDEPLELKYYARDSNLAVDTIGLLRALDSKTVNATAAGKIMKFFNADYYPLLYGLGFDQAAYKTRGSYLNAFFRHLIRNSDVPNKVRLNAKILLPFILTEGPGAEPVDMNEGIVPDNRRFMNRMIPPWSLQSEWFTTISSRNLPVNSTSVRRRDSQSVIPRDEPYYNRRVKDSFVARQINSKIVETMTKKQRNDSRDSIDDEEERQHARKIRRSSRRLLSINDGDSRLKTPALETRIILLNSEKTLSDEKRRAKSEEINVEMESATFHPDEVLYESNARMTVGPEESIEPEDAQYIIDMDETDSMFDEKKPVKPIEMRPDQLLPATGHSKAIPHRLSKIPESIDLVSRKLFVREGNARIYWEKFNTDRKQLTKKEPSIDDDYEIRR